MTNTELANKAIALLMDGTPPVCEPADPRPISWLTAWREVVALTRGITIADPRMPAIMEALKRCDAAFEADRWAAFERATAVLRQAVKGSLGGKVVQ